MNVAMRCLKKVGWWVIYMTEITGLALEGDISWVCWRYAAVTFPAAVCGPAGAWVVDPNFKM